MKIILLLVGLFGLANANGIHWDLYKAIHKKTYEDPAEEATRRSIFSANKQKIEHHNAEAASRLGYRMGYSHLTDWTNEELSQLNGLRVFETELSLREEMIARAPESIRMIKDIDVGRLPKRVDWRNKPGIVTSVKDQGKCGSCWAFATTGLLEGQETNEKVSSTPLSEQDLVDCSSSNHGCKGGSMLRALKDIHDLGGIESEHDYPYLDVNGPVEHKCAFNRTKSVLNIKGYDWSDGTEDELKRYVAQYGPVAVGFAVSDKFFHYSGGVFSDDNCYTYGVNHAMLVVGYGTNRKDGDYWIVKNSWGPDWGEGGYVRTARNKDNMCQIADIAVLAYF